MTTISGAKTAMESAIEVGATAVPAQSRSESTYHVSLGYLRAFLVVLVVAHHAVLAYHPFAPPEAAGSLVTQPRWWGIFPVVDSQRWTGFAIFTGFNDVFFMSLMFFVSGLFVWGSLQRKGVAQFVRDRAMRLGIPFMVAAAVVAPLGYFPAYLQRNPHGSVGEFVRQWLSLGEWPAGPAWFAWVLLAFGCVAALLTRFAPSWAERVGRSIEGVSRRPLAFFALLSAISIAVYVPLAVVFNPLQWTTVGPFAFQTSRVLHYLLYFVMGCAVGACGLNQGLLARDGKLARRWLRWTFGALLAFALATVAAIAASTAQPVTNALIAISSVTFSLSCAASSLACLAIFLRFAGLRRGMFDSLANNSYGIYLVHYAFATWLQYALLTAPLPALVKGLAVSLCALVLSWIVIAAMRRIPAVARVV